MFATFIRINFDDNQLQFHLPYILIITEYGEWFSLSFSVLSLLVEFVIIINYDYCYWIINDEQLVASELFMTDWLTERNWIRD